MSSWFVGKIEGTTGTEGFSMILERQDVGKNDYVQVRHEGKDFLLMIKEVERAGDGKMVAECSVIGAPPKTPFVPGSEVMSASEELLRRGLGIDTGEAEGIYVGKLRNLDCRVWLPIKKMTRIFIVGKPGSGKSYTMGVIAEEFIKKGIPLVIIDAHGEYSSLKVPANAPSAEFGVSPKSYSESIVEFANLTFNPGADLDIAALDSSKADDIVSQMQCTIINLRGLGNEEQYQVVYKVLTKLLEAIMVMQIQPFYLALDEAHLFAGRNRRDDPAVRQVLESVRRFAQEGRKFGAHMIVMTQRPQLLDMTVRSLSATWIIHRLTDPNDVRIAVESGGLGKEWEADINWLEPGNAVITGDVVERTPLLVRVRERETTHGAPGFNPLDFVSPEERDRMRKRISKLKERLLREGTAAQKGGRPQPQLPQSVPSLYLPVNIGESDILGKLKEDRSVDAADLLKFKLSYIPALFAEATVEARRKDPDLHVKERIRRLVPASADVQPLDWRYESAFGIEAKDVLSQPTSPVPPREGEHVQAAAALLDPSAVENLKGTFRMFAVSKLTQTVHYHQKLGEFSRPGEPMDEFKSRLRAKADSVRSHAESEIRERYSQQLKEVRSSASAVKDESASLEKLVSSIKDEIKSLEKERLKAEKEGRSTLKVSQQIQTREVRLSRLEQRLAKAREEIVSLTRREGEIQEKIRGEVKRVAQELETMVNEPLTNLVFQPRPEEVEIEAMQVIWVPRVEALFRISFHGEDRDFRMEWNAVNGRGKFGECSECGSQITALEGPIFCYTCGETFCNEHLVSCSLCGRTSCQPHSWKCPECGKQFCADEPYFECAACSTRICTGCAKECRDCGDEKRYCSDHVKKCGVCGSIYCEGHYEKHIGNCRSCGKELCILEQVKCSVCGQTFCESHVVKCSACGEEVCVDHSWTCSACGKPFCKKELPYLCKICGKPFCNTCSLVCSVCGERVCREHSRKCPECGRTVCPNCLVEKKRLGIFKRAVCSHCAQR
ncbi:MAG: DUF87 domain-containing protein [Candidatus Methanosuratincola sp.]